MSVYPCAVHGQRISGRLASLYSAWFLADGSRTAWKQRICANCVRSTLVELLAHAADSITDVVACPACGSDSSADLDPIYCTLYLPKQDPREYALSTCGPCAAKLRLRLQDGAQRLPDRNGGSAGGSSQAEDDSWAGILP
jgi:DNA-directed RNA polymerase subunit RPC12/RpoP